MRSLSDDLWQVIRDYLKEHNDIDISKVSDEVWDAVEKNANIECFDGGAFISIGNEFDLFVLPERRGKWRIRSTLTDYLDRMSALHGSLVVEIDEGNRKSLRLAKHFGFHEVNRKDGIIKLERSWPQ